MLLFTVLTAALFRLWELGRLPPGLYRDEAKNGLDALNVLRGQHQLFFPANNGREPLYIYLTSFFVSLFGRSSTAVRLAAAVTGTLTTCAAYLLANSWFGGRAGLLSAWLWAVTLWPVHLSRIGLRPILVAPLLAIMFWVGTAAYRRQRRALWFLSGLVYGLAFYTYLAIRFTPLLLGLFAVYLALTGRWNRLKPGLLWFALGAALSLAPLAYVVLQQPGLILGRMEQVSILNPTINQGQLWQTLSRNGIKGLGLFLWKGDAILRHNPAGRPVFDLFMALPFLAGVFWCARQWRRPAAMGLLLWLGVMLGPTVLAEDTPHFLRAAGLLPAVVIVPAIGLGRLWTRRALAPRLRQTLVLGLVAGTTLKTAFDYIDYAKSTDVAYLFESAAAELAQQIKGESPGTDIYMDQRFWSNNPSIEFLVGDRPISLFQPEMGLSALVGPDVAIYAWPYGPLDFVPQALQPPALITADNGGLSRDDLDELANPLFVRYSAHPIPPEFGTSLVSFDDQLQLSGANITVLNDKQIEVDLFLETQTAVRQELVLFVHVIGVDGLMMAQDDDLPADGRWPRQWWIPGLLIRDRHIIDLPEAYDSDRHQLSVGVYDAQTHTRLPVMDHTGKAVGDTWILAGQS